MVNYDAIRLFAVVAIVVLHSAANGVNRLPLGSADWWLANLLDSAARAGVPLFLMLTGALLLNRPPEPFRQFYRRRWQRLGVPLLCWSAFYLLWSALKAKVKQQPYTITDAINALIAGTPYFHLWFIFMLAGIYLLLPALRLLWQPLGSKAKLSLTFGALLLQQSLQLVAISVGYWPELPWFCWFIAYLPYVLLGAWLSQPLAPINSKINQPAAVPRAQWLLLPAFVALTLVTAMLYYWQQIAPTAFFSSFSAWLANAPVAYAYHRLSLPVLLLAVLLWFLLGQNPWLGRQSQTSSGRFLLIHSLGIYCVHPVLLDISSMLLQQSSAGNFAYPLQLLLQISLILAGSMLFCYGLASVNSRLQRPSPSS